jgi:hypothetical protein
MESRFKNRVSKTVTLITVLLLFAGSISQAQVNIPVKLKEHGIKNLLAGINSENSGLKRSSVYFAGKYKLTDAINTLADQLTKVENANTRLLIALALYQIGSDESFSVIKKAAINDDDPKVRRICREIYNTFLENSYTASSEEILN